MENVVNIERKDVISFSRMKELSPNLFYVPMTFLDLSLFRGHHPRIRTGHLSWEHFPSQHNKTMTPAKRLRFKAPDSYILRLQFIFTKLFRINHCSWTCNDTILKLWRVTDDSRVRSRQVNFKCPWQDKKTDRQQSNDWDMF